jgi:hypothetical protein
MYIYTFPINSKNIEIEAINLENACKKLLNNPLEELANFEIEKRGTRYLQSTPFNERTHTVKFGNTVCIVKQRKI